MTYKTRKSNPPTRFPTLAILSDVHGNLPALEAVIAHAQQQHASIFWNLGDFLGYGPYVNEVVDLLFEICSAQVVGNYDLKVLRFNKKRKKWQKTKKKEKYIAFHWAWQKLSTANAKRLAGLPLNDVQIVAGLSFLLTHGGPAAVDEAIGPSTSRERFQKLASMTESHIVLCGHTHLPFLKTINHTTFVNPGSVGRPEGGDPRASYAIVTISSAGIRVDFHKVGYDIDRLKRAVHAAGLPDDFAKMFTNGRNLDQIQESRTEKVDHKPPDTAKKILQIRRFAEQCRYEQAHSEQVTKLCILLFQKLKKVHGMNSHGLFLLTCAAILHDIGWIQGQASHHKTSMRMILDDRTMPLNETERKLTAMIARYHRKALPRQTHAVYRDLTPDQQHTVHILGGLLRIADGLDRSHMNAVTDIHINISGRTITFTCTIQGPGIFEIAAARKKADLFADATGYTVRFVYGSSGV